MSRATPRASERFVGRERELAVVADLLQRTRAGRPAPLVVTGSSGTGKSMVAHRAAALAVRSGFAVLAIDGDSDATQLPFDALRRAVRQWHDDATRPVPPALLAPVLAALGAGTGTRQMATTDATRRMLDGMSFRQPVLLVVDDLQFADEETADLVLFLLRHLRRARVMVMVTHRTADAGSGVLDDLRRSHAAEQVVRLELGPFDDAELTALVAARTGHTPAAELVAVVRERTGGVPFFASQMVGALVDHGLERAADGTVTIGRHDLPLPRRVATTVLHRIFSLGPDARQIAVVVALLGRVSIERIAVLTAVTGISTERTDEAFDVLVGGGVLEEDTGAFRFTHAIIRDALRTDLDPAARRRLHDSIAVALSEHRGQDAERDAVEIGDHLRRGTGEPDIRAAELLAAAGDAVLAIAPARSATAWYRDALGRLRPDDPLGATLQIRLAVALDLGGRRTEALRVAGATLRHLAPGGDRARAATVAAHAAFATGRFDHAARILDDALAEPDTATTALMLHRARLHAWQRQCDDAARLVGDALAAGVAADDPMVHTVRAMLGIHGDDQPATTAAVAALRASAGAASVPSRRTDTLAACIAAAVHLDPDDAIDDAADVDIDHPMGAWFRSAAAWALLRAGRLDDAVAAGEAASGSIDPASGDLFAGLAAATVVLALLERDGRQAAADRAAWAAPIRGGAFACALDVATARLLAAQGSPGPAHELLELARRREAAAGATTASALVLGEQIELAVLTGDLAGARARNAELQRLPRDPAAVAVTIRCLLGDALTSSDAAAAHAARAYACRHGLQLDAAWALAIAGSRGGDEDALIAAHDELGRLGALVRQRRVAGRLRTLGRRAVPRARGRREALSAIELEVTSHVAGGLTNRQIATLMSLSPKTIEVYLSRIYAKTGCRSRVELAVAVRAGTMVAPA